MSIVNTFTKTINVSQCDAMETMKQAGADGSEAPAPVFSARRVEGAGEVLALIRGGRAKTITELAAAMNMARSTVVDRLQYLTADGLVVTGADGLGATLSAPGARGRPATVLRFNPGAGVVLAAQLGMTGARLGATDLDGTVLAERSEPIPVDWGPDAVLGHLEQALWKVLAATGRARSDVRGLGVGVPSAVELPVADGREHAPTVSWAEFPVASRLRDAFGVPIFVDHDVHLLALGEQRSAWPKTDVLLCVKVGSVIDCGIVVRGDVVRGAQGAAGNIGHMAVAGDITPCTCGNVGCLDAVASGRALVTRLQAAGSRINDVPQLAALAREGTPEIVTAIRSAGRRLGEVLAHAVNLLNPGVIAFWGYLAEGEAGSALLAGVRESIYQRSLPSATGSLQLVRARLGDHAGLVGAALMVVSELLAPDVLEEYLASRAASPQSPASHGR